MELSLEIRSGDCLGGELNMAGWDGFWIAIGIISAAEIVMEYFRKYKWIKK